MTNDQFHCGPASYFSRYGWPKGRRQAYCSAESLVYFRSRGSNNRPFVSGSDPNAQCAAVQLRRLGIIPSWHADQTTDEEEEGDRSGLGG